MGFLPIASVSEGEFRFSDVPLPGSWEQWVDSLSTPVSIVVIGFGFLGLLFGWLIGRSQRREAEQAVPSDSVVTSPSEPPRNETPPEWIWRHEKLVLLERQEAERQDRLQGLVDGVARAEAPAGIEVRARLFGLAEQMRDYRQRVGSEVSRLSCLRERLAAIGAESDSGDPDSQRKVADECDVLAEAQLSELEEVRDRLRGPTLAICDLERSWAESEEDPAARLEPLADRLGELESPLAELPRDFHRLTEETDSRIRETLAGRNEPAFEAIRSVLLVDGAVTSSRSDSEWVPVESLRRLVERLRNRASQPGPEMAELEAPVPPPEEPEEPGDSGFSPPTNGFVLPVRPVPMRPDAGFRPPIPPVGSEAEALPAEETAVEETPAEEPAEAPPSTETEKPGNGTWVVFRSNQVEDWGRTFYEGRNRRARKMDRVPEWAEWISMRRIDTGERVFLPASSCLTSSDESEAGLGFNASNEKFYGARHLGVFSASCPNEVETRFTYGGWGFGHRVGGLGESDGDPQASGWAGLEIPADTVFEIAFLDRLPEDAEDSEVLSREAVTAPAPSR